MSNYIKVNQNFTFEYLYFENMIPLEPYFKLNTVDIASVEKAFQDIDQIELYTDNELTNVYTEWGTYNRIWIEVDDDHSYYVCISLKQADLQSQIRKLDNIINPKYNPDTMTLEELRDYVKMITSNKCREIIYAGVEVETSYGKELFTFNADDQQNLKELCDMALQTQVDMPYHKNGDNNNCTIYPWQDIVKIYATLSANKLYHTTYQNAINNYIPNIYDTDVLMNLKYGDKLPENYEENIDKMLTQGQKAINAIMIKAGLIENSEESETSEQD